MVKRIAIVVLAASLLALSVLGALWGQYSETAFHSLFWFAFNTSKRGITLDIEKPEGLDLFKRLARTADLVVESFPPGYMEKLGLGNIKKTLPELVRTLKKTS